MSAVGTLALWLGVLLASSVLIAVGLTFLAFWHAKRRTYKAHDELSPGAGQVRRQLHVVGS